MLFGWRKRNEGFEWREYVRTTILVRRADRQKRLDDARLAALSAVKDAKDRGVNAGIAKVDAVREGAAAAGRRAGGALAGAAMAAAGKAAEGVRVAAGSAAQAAAAIPRPAAPALIKRPVADIAMYGADLPRRWRLLKPYLLPAAGVTLAVFVFGSALSPNASSVSSSSASAPLAQGTPITTGSVTTSDNVISGRASTSAGGLIRIGGKLIQLAGIDTPHPAQPCFKENGRQWACAASAQSALRKLVRGKSIACELKDGSGEGPALANCRAGSIDLAAALVRKGHVFAAADGPYTSEEEAARSEKLGLWQGQSARPEDWRKQVWEEAKRAAPDGCPIKGLVRSDGRVYAMPWSEGYGTRSVRSVKGERWFCSEDEARAAGFKNISQL